MKNNILATVAASAILVGMSGVGNAGTLDLMSLEFQNNTSVGSGEIVTNAAATPNGGGGVVTYDKILNLHLAAGLPQVKVLIVRFSAQADAHNGSAVLMNALVNGHLVEPLEGQTDNGGGGPFLQTGWWTLLHPPTGIAGTCGDGGGGTADCHDNTIAFAGCYVLGPDESPDFARVQIKLADMPGSDINTAFYERATIEIDGSGIGGARNFCRGASTEAHE